MHQSELPSHNLATQPRFAVHDKSAARTFEYFSQEGIGEDQFAISANENNRKKSGLLGFWLFRLLSLQICVEESVVD